MHDNDQGRTITATLMISAGRVIALAGILSLITFACRESARENTIDPRPVSTLFGAPEAISTLAAHEVPEASGLAISRSGTFLWTHNDSGGEAELYLLDSTGTYAGKYRLDGARNVDWEDMAIGPGPEDARHYLYVGDIGDNDSRRKMYHIYRVPEPDLSRAGLPVDGTLTAVETIRFVYPDGPKDAETLMADPLTGDLYILSKREARVSLYVLPYPQETIRTDTAERLGTIPFTRVVAGDISPDGQAILIKNYSNIYHWHRANEPSLLKVLSGTPDRLNYIPEPQGEALAWHTDGLSYYTLSEKNRGAPAVLYRYRRN